MDIDQFLERSIISFLDSKIQKEEKPIVEREEEYGLYLNKDYMRELVADLENDELSKAKKLFDELKARYNVLPKNSLERKSIYSLLEQMYILIEKYVDMKEKELGISGNNNARGKRYSDFEKADYGASNASNKDFGGVAGTSGINGPFGKGEEKSSIEKLRSFTGSNVPESFSDAKLRNDIVQARNENKTPKPALQIDNRITPGKESSSNIEINQPGGTVNIIEKTKPLSVQLDPVKNFQAENAKKEIMAKQSIVPTSSSPENQKIHINVNSAITQSAPKADVKKVPVFADSYAAIQKYKTDIRKTDARKTGIQEADIQRADIQRADIQEADIQRADIREADIREADIQRTDIQKDRLESANIILGDVKDNSSYAYRERPAPTISGDAGIMTRGPSRKDFMEDVDMPESPIENIPYEKSPRVFQQPVIKISSTNIAHEKVLKGTTENVSRKKAQELYEAGLYNMFQSNYVEASRIFERLIELRPKNRAARIRLTECREVMENA